jgi:hypothetical protein
LQDPAVRDAFGRNENRVAEPAVVNRSPFGDCRRELALIVIRLGDNRRALYTLNRYVFERFRPIQHHCPPMPARPPKNRG